MLHGLLLLCPAEQSLYCLLYQRPVVIGLVCIGDLLYDTIRTNFVAHE